LPDVGSMAKGRAVVNLLRLQADEKLAAMLSVREFDEGRFVVLATRRGYIKKTPLPAFSRPRSSGIIGTTIAEGDHLLAATLSGGSDEIFMATARGKSIRFNESDVRPMGRAARGVHGIRVGKDDEVVTAEVLSGKPDILTVTANGYGKRTPVGEYRLQSRGGSGIINMRATARNGNVVASMAVDDEDHLLMITKSGKIIRMNVTGISRIGRATQGVRVIQTANEDVVVSAIRTAEDEGDVPLDDDGAAADTSSALGSASEAPAVEDGTDTDRPADSTETNEPSE